MIKIDNDNKITIDNVIPIIRGNRIIKFITNISIKEIGEVYEKLTYDPETQRGKKEVIKKKSVEMAKIVHKENIEEIKSKVLDGFFDGGLLTWNVRINKTDEKVYSYCPDENKAIIKANLITIPDSFHRHEALKELADTNIKGMESYYLPLSISLYNFEEEQILFSEINGSGKNVKKTRSLYLSNTQRSKMTKKLIKESLLNENINTVTGFAREELTNFARLYESLFDASMGAYKDVKDNELEELKVWLTRFYNEVVELRDEWGKIDLSQRKEYKKKSLIASDNMIIALAHVSKELRHDKNWKTKLKRINNEYEYGSWKGDFFDIKNPLWSQTLTYLNIKDELKISSYSTRHVNIAKDRLFSYLNLGVYSFQ